MSKENAFKNDIFEQDVAFDGPVATEGERNSSTISTGPWAAKSQAQALVHKSAQNRTTTMSQKTRGILPGNEIPMRIPIILW